MPRNRASALLTMAAAVTLLGFALLMPSAIEGRPGQNADRAAPPARDFPLPGGDLGNQRYSTLTGITPANIGRLGGAWMVHVLDGKPGNMQATPVVVDGVMSLPPKLAVACSRSMPRPAR